jgi:biopolymer transport protein ExbD
MKTVRLATLQHCLLLCQSEDVRGQAVLKGKSRLFRYFRKQRHASPESRPECELLGIHPMKTKRTTKLLAEAPAVTTGDIAFNLIVFFLVCASSQPDTGRKQDIPGSETTHEQQQEKATHIEVLLTRTTVTLNGDVVAISQFVPRLRQLLASKTRVEDKLVVVKSKPETTYQHWILVTSLIEEAGGTVTIQREEEHEVQIPG